ncbi:N-acetylmuramoyl-L-alanine amidase [Candidatus Peregrinibacteria bacterium]|nr:N-acetylmuramoyl-L-alanine amidase [Candidatus Peregrinibacteria bacterium]
MEIVNRRLTLAEFRGLIATFDFGPISPDKLVIHHTWKPTQATWAGQRSINGLKAYYEGKGWPAGPHLFVAEDGIWLFSPMNKDGIHAGTLNFHSIGIEVVGDYDNEVWSGQTKANALGVIKVLMDRLSIPQGQVFFHRDVSPKTCPGRAITKEWLFAELATVRVMPRIPRLAEDGPLSISAPVPSTNPSTFVPVPEWAMEAVRFVTDHQLFEVKNDDDIRDAVKFHRFYQLIQSSHG